MTLLPVDHIQLINHNSRTLRSSVSKQLLIPKTKLNIDKRAFSVAAPIIWNQLPITIKFSESVDTFHKKLNIFV